MPEPSTFSWREQAVSRSLDSARARAEKRVQRFLDAALELMNAAPDKDITVQEVIERSGQSLRSFYQHFAGKHELLLALFEEAVRSTAIQLAERTADVDDPLERLHTLVVEYHRMCRPTSKERTADLLTPAMADFAQQLLTKQPREASRAFVPLVALFDDALRAAGEAGAVRTTLPVTGVLLQAIMFNAFAETISSSAARDRADQGEQLWDLLLHGIRA